MSTHTDAERTKEYITEALFQLMKTTPYEKITILEIAKKAGVGRVTYYRHFTSKNDIIIQYFSKEIAAFALLFPRKPQTKDDYYELIFTVFHFLREKKELMQLIQKAGLEMIYLDFLNQTLLKDFEDSQRKETVYSAYYAAGCLFNVSMQWVKNDCKESVKFIADTYYEHVFSDFN